MAPAGSLAVVLRRWGLIMVAYRLDEPPLVIAHRGASGYRPEHTLPAYELAARLGADGIEADLVMTGDGVVICRHENELSRTTDVATRPEFAARRTTRVVDGQERCGWFSEDFTLAEIKTLWASERLPRLRQANTVYERRLRVPTFAELLALRRSLSQELSRIVGISPELKHAAYFRARGLDLEEAVAGELRDARLDAPNAPVFVQTFELTSLIRLREDVGLRTPLLLLTQREGGPTDLAGTADERTYADLVTPRALRLIATWVSGIGPSKDQVIARRPDGTLGGPTSLVRNAHEHGLRVHVWTFRAENAFLPTDLRTSRMPQEFGDGLGELAVFARAGVDALITDHPDLAVHARAEVFAPA